MLRPPPRSPLFPYTTLFRSLFAMQVIACDPYLDAATIAARGAVKVTLEELLRRADFVSINCPLDASTRGMRSEEHTSELQSRGHLVCRLLLEKKKKKTKRNI